MELTEHSRVADYPALMRTLQSLRATGARLAIDDTGAGFSSLSHILKLAPDFIKLDRELVAGIDLDPVRRVLASSLVGFAGSTGAVIIAEGVETGDELETLESLGIGLSQGFHFGRPVSLESLFGSLLLERQRHGAAALRSGTR
jgi:EAL domain-containing protein (putative c-di-GMP-specific phosphodiesterase class I)